MLGGYLNKMRAVGEQFRLLYLRGVVVILPIEQSHEVTANSRAIPIEYILYREINEGMTKQNRKVLVVPLC